jgi:hypothetical protein
MEPGNPSVLCLRCANMVLVAVQPGDERPASGDLLVRANCFHPMMFDDGLALRDLTEDEQAAPPPATAPAPTGAQAGSRSASSSSSNGQMYT